MLRQEELAFVRLIPTLLRELRMAISRRKK
jgi:hypothetical protein